MENIILEVKGFSKYKFAIKFAKILKLDQKLIKKVTYNDIKFLLKEIKI